MSRNLRLGDWLAFGLLLAGCSDDPDARRTSNDDGSTSTELDGSTSTELDGSMREDASSAGDGGHEPLDAVSTSDSASADGASERDGGDGSTDEPDAGPVDPPPALQWTRDPNAFTGMRAIWGSGPDDIYLVGAAGQIAHSTGDGQWTLQQTETGALLNGVWGSGPEDIYVTAYANLILHSTGDGTWEHQVTGSGDLFLGLWGSGPTDIYAHGGPNVHSTGDGGWTPITISTTEPILDFWGTAATDVYAVGNMRNVYRRNPDGSWTGQQPGATGLLAMSGSAPDDLYVNNRTKIFHSRGDGRWTEQAVPLREGDALIAMWSLDRHAVYAITHGAILRSSGDGVWLSQALDPANLEINAFDIWGTSPTNLYVVTSSGLYHGTLP